MYLGGVLKGAVAAATATAFTAFFQIVSRKDHPPLMIKNKIHTLDEACGCFLRMIW